MARLEIRTPSDEAPVTMAREATMATKILGGPVKATPVTQTDPPLAHLDSLDFLVPL